MLVVMSVVLMTFTVAGNHGLLHLFKINNELSALARKNRSIESDILQTRSEIDSLARSRFTIEKQAREELGLSRPDEVVYVFPHRK